MADSIRRILVRRDTLDNWTGIVPQNGEPIGIITDDPRVTVYKIGDGATAADQLPALSKGDKGSPGTPGADGAQGLPGTNAVPADEAVAGYVSTTGTSSTRTALDGRYLAPRGIFPITNYGAKRAVYLTDAAMTAGSAVLSTSYSFTSADVGKVIGVRGAGPVSTDYSVLANDGSLVSTIASVSGGVATLADPAVNTCSAARAAFGTPVDAALRAANAAARDAGGGTVFVPAGVWVGAQQVVFSSTVGLAGAGKTLSRLYYIHSDDGSSYDQTPWLYWNEKDPTDQLRHDVNLTDFLVDGMFFVGTAGYSFRAKLLLVDRTLDSVVRNISVLNSPATAIGYDVSQRCIIEGVTVINAGRFAYVNSNRGNSSGSAIGIAVTSDSDNVSMVIRDNFLFGGWTSSKGTGRSGINLEGIFASDGSSAVRKGSYLVSGNVVEGFYAGIRDSGGRGSRIIGNEVRKCQIGVLLGSKGSAGSRMPLEIIVQSNIIRDGVNFNLSTGAAAASSGIEINTTATDVPDPDVSGRYVVTGNVVSNIPGNGIFVNGATVSGTVVPVNGVIIGQNVVRACTGFGVQVAGAVNQISVLGNLIDGNVSYGININNGAVVTGGIIANNTLMDLAASPTQINSVKVGTTATMVGVQQFGNTGDVPSGSTEAFARVTTTNVTNTITLANVTGGSLPVAANTTYQFDAVIEYTSSAAAGLRLHWSYPSGATVFWAVDGLNAPSAMISGINNASLPGVDGATSIIAKVKGTIVVGATPGSVGMQFAQNVATADTATITNRSTMELRRVS